MSVHQFTTDEVLKAAAEREEQRQIAESFDVIDHFKRTNESFNRLFVNTPTNPQTYKDLGKDI
jgi:hypothetical protein